MAASRRGAQTVLLILAIVLVGGAVRAEAASALTPCVATADRFTSTVPMIAVQAPRGEFSTARLGFLLQLLFYTCIVIFCCLIGSPYGWIASALLIICGFIIVSGAISARAGMEQGVVNSLCASLERRFPRGPIPNSALSLTVPRADVQRGLSRPG